MMRELGEIIAYAITAYKKSMPVDKIFTVTPTDANGWMAHYIVDAIEHHAVAGLQKANETEFVPTGFSGPPEFLNQMLIECITHLTATGALQLDDEETGCWYWKTTGTRLGMQKNEIAPPASK